MSFFSRGLWGRSADTSHGDTRTGSTSGSHSSVVSLLPSTRSGAHGSALTSAVSELPETRRLVVKTALDHLFGERHFNVCALQKIMDIVQAPHSGEAYRLLSALHCIDYAAMSPEMRERIPALVAEALKGGNASRIATDAVMADLDRA